MQRVRWLWSTRSNSVDLGRLEHCGGNLLPGMVPVAYRGISRERLAWPMLAARRSCGVLHSLAHAFAVAAGRYRHRGSYGYRAFGNAQYGYICMQRTPTGQVASVPPLQRTLMFNVGGFLAGVIYTIVYRVATGKFRLYESHGDVQSLLTNWIRQNFPQIDKLPTIQNRGI